ncbi:MAG: hypothetical protein ACREOC_16705 [Gemmatimonadales bacterium]
MSVADPKMLASVEAFLARQKLDYEPAEEQYGEKLTVRSGAQTVPVSVFNSGRIVVGGKESALKQLLEQMRIALEAGDALPGQALPFEIERFPEVIRERVLDVDPVIVRFIEEAIACLKANALLATAFMLGAASERAINLMIQTYLESVKDPTNKERLASRLNGRAISRRYEEFERSYGGCKSKPTDPALANDLTVVLGSVFQFCRITRNEVGHPQIVPDLDRGVLLANLAHFVTYIERVCGLMNHFKTQGVEL